MYHLIDEQRVKIYYMNRLTRGELVDPFSFVYKNVKYKLRDDPVSIRQIEFVEKPAYVVTKDGLVEWEPSYIVDGNEKEPLELSKHGVHLSKYRFMTTYVSHYSIEKQVTFMLPPERQVCSNYVCFEELKDPIQLTKKDFGVDVKSTMYENENELIVKTNSYKFTFGAKIGNIWFTLLEVDGHSLIFKKGSCFFIEELNRYACYQ